MRPGGCFFLAAVLVSGCKKDPTETGPAVGTGEPSSTTPTVEITPLGTPMWEIAELLLFTGPAGDGTQVCLLDGPHDFDGTVWAPGTPHGPPYTGELAARMEPCGLTAPEIFQVSDLQAPNGIWLGMILAPTEGNVPGSSVDFGLDSVIYSDRFPMVVDADVRKGESLVDTDNDFIFPDPSAWGHVVTGHSHVPLIFGTTHERMPAGAAPDGDYSWTVSLRDATSINAESGYDVVVPYRVLPPTELPQ